LDGALPIHLALLARATGRSVRLALSREEVLLVGGKRHPYQIRTRLGLDADGRILGLDTDAIVDTGPYASEGPSVLRVSEELSTGSYRVQAARFRGRLVYTNNGNAGAFRGYGVPQVTFALESALDLAAAKLGLDPVEIRRRNVLEPGASQGMYGHNIGAGFRGPEVLDAAARHPWWRDRARWKASGAWPWRRGTGMALASKGVGYGTGRGDVARARLRVSPQGRVAIEVGPNHSGQSIETAYAQIAGQALGLDPSEIDVVVGDTDLVPESGSCSASRSTYVGGSAVRLICEELLQRIGVSESPETTDWERIGHQLNATGQQLVEATFTLPEVDMLGMPWADEPPEVRPAPHVVFSTAAQVARVEVNELTGETRVMSMACALDCGVPINPAGVKGQAVGGLAQGLGYALMEEYRLHEGRPETTSLETYLIPTSADIPQVDVVVVDGFEGTGPYGAKGMAEVVLCPTAPALVSAISDAVGVHIEHLPATPERVYRALKGTPQ
jgi:CO/xanthine dehydrogenase Mo-binding subunit